MGRKKKGLNFVARIALISEKVKDNKVALQKCTDILLKDKIYSKWVNNKGIEFIQLKNIQINSNPSSLMHDVLKTIHDVSFNKISTKVMENAIDNHLLDDFIYFEGKYKIAIPLILKRYDYFKTDKFNRPLMQYIVNTNREPNKRNNTKMSKSNHNLNSNNNNMNNNHNEHIDYLTAKSPRQNTIDSGDNNDIKTVIIHNEHTQNNNNKNILNTNRNVNPNPNLNEVNTR
eukprot:448650_1